MIEQKVQNCMTQMIKSQVSWHSRWFFVSNYFRGAAHGCDRYGKVNYCSPDEVREMEHEAIRRWREYHKLDVNGKRI